MKFNKRNIKLLRKKKSDGVNWLNISSHERDFGTIVDYE